MAKKFLVPIDLSQLELQNAALQNLPTASEPSSPVKGQMYFNSTTNVAKIWNGTAWVPWEANSTVSPATANPSMDGTAAVGTSAKYAREDHVHPTDTSRAPTNHASSATTYGKGTSSNYGHVKLTDAYVNAQTASDGTAATPKAVNDAYNAAVEDVQGLLGDAAEKNVDTSISSGSTSTNLPTSAAVATFVSNQIGAVDAMRFKGTLGTGGTVTSLPTSNVKVGDTYRVITAGTYAGQTCEVGDLIIATATTPTWTVAQTNIDGAITTAGTGLSKSGSTINHSNSVTAKTTQALYPIAFDAQGHITGSGTAITNATTTTGGLMSASDKTSLGSLAVASIKTNTQFSITAGKTTLVVTLSTPQANNGLIPLYEAYSGGEKVEIDFGYTVDSAYQSTLTWSIASAISNAVSIVTYTVPSVTLTQTSLT